MAGLERRDGLCVHSGSYGLHHKISEEKREADQGLVGRRGLRAERLAQEMEYDQDAHERRHREKDGGKQREQGEEKNNCDGGGIAAHADAWNLQDGSLRSGGSAPIGKEAHEGRGTKRNREANEKLGWNPH